MLKRVKSCGSLVKRRKGSQSGTIFFPSRPCLDRSSPSPYTEGTCMHSFLIKSLTLLFILSLSLSACGKKGGEGSGGSGVGGTAESGPSAQGQHLKEEAANDEEALAIILDEPTR